MRNPKCTDCRLHRTTKNVCVWGSGDATSRIMIVGEAPGEAEARTGLPFQGKSGQLLREELAKVGLSDAYITNVVKCRPPDNRKPEADELEACRKYFDAELESVDPSHMLVLGATSAKAILRKTKITEIAGQVFQKDGRTIVPGFHPAYILRDPSKMPAFRLALSRFANEVLKDQQGDPDTFTFRVVEKDNFDEFLTQYAQATELAFDIETTGLEWWDESLQVNCVQFALNPGDTWVLPVAKARIMPEENVGVLLRILAKESYKKKIVAGQNAKFDNNWLQRRYGARFKLTFDTMLAHHLCDENSPHDLKWLARYFLGAPDYDLSLKEKKGDVDPMKLFEYGARDTRYTLQLVPILTKLLKDEDQWRLFNRLTMRAARAMERIEQRGFWINLDKFERVAKETKQAMEDSVAKLNKMAGEDINWNAPAQVARILFEKLKLKPRLKTGKGEPSTSEAAIIDIDHPIAHELVEYRKHAKFLSTYIDGWRPMMIGNLLFIGYKLHGTVTGRYSSRLHSIPRDGTIRNLVEAPPGWAMVAADYSQIELRLAAHHSGDTQMLYAFQNGIDIHILTAQRVSGIENPTKEERKKAKPINFGFLYGMWWVKFREYAKVNYGVEFTDTEAQEAREVFFQLYSSLPKWHNKQKSLARMDGFVRNVFGRKRRLPAILSNDKGLRQEAERQGINSPIQGGGGDLKGAAMVELDESFDDDVLQVIGEHHDAILMWVKQEHLQAVLPRVKSIMEHPKLLDELGIVFRVPIEVEIEVGPWGAGTKWEPPK